MKDDNYEKLQQQIKKANVNHKVGDIRDILLTDNNKYDLVNLSSIILTYCLSYLSSGTLYGIIDRFGGTI